VLRKQILRLGSKGMFLSQVKNIFVSRTQTLIPNLMFPSLATQGNMSGNNVSAAMFPSLVSGTPSFPKKSAGWIKVKLIKVIFKTF